MSSRTGWAIAISSSPGSIRARSTREQAKLLDTYVRRGIYTVNEARDLLGLVRLPAAIGRGSMAGRTGAAR